jgi:predicted SnoaL-like aldol condensation-catalyzing enzyme
VDVERLLETNKRTVTEFYEAVVNRRDFAAASRFIGDRYIQHNPLVGDGVEGLCDFIEFLRTEFPEAHNQTLRVFAEDDHVILHVHSVRSPGTRGRAIVEVFRLDGRKIVEHWDVIQEIPATSANGNGMF